MPVRIARSVAGARVMSEPVHRVHAMPFGPEALPHGRYRFRLWAPGAQRVDLCHGTPAAQRVRPMAGVDAGWWQVTAEARPGDRYRFRIDGDLRVPDPASRHQPEDVHGPSELVDPLAFAWQDVGWRGRPWAETVLYELHVGTFSPEGTFRGVEARLDHLVELGVTAVELMPVADFPGARNWGYDGVLPFAPDATYGRPEDLKSLVQAAHRRELMIFLDVVYNHFGPAGNYLHAYASPMFTTRYATPWGAAIDYEGERSRTVRDFFIHNALYWLEEYHLDGLRLDAVHAIFDRSKPDILTELASAVRRGPGRNRHVHLVLENDHNEAHRLRPDADTSYDAQWNDDLHHVLHVAGTREQSGYYVDYPPPLGEPLARALGRGFVYQGQPSVHRGGRPRGEATGGVPLTAFVGFLQNHDQIGNRAMGERITALASAEAVAAATATLLLSPAPPLLFMGQEWAALEPFLFFCDFADEELRRAVRRGRRQEFVSFPEFAATEARARIPDPNASETFARSRLDWSALDLPVHREWLRFHKRLISVRREQILVRLSPVPLAPADAVPVGRHGARLRWRGADGARVTLVANLGDAPVVWTPPPVEPVFVVPAPAVRALGAGRLEPWSVALFVEPAAKEAS